MAALFGNEDDDTKEALAIDLFSEAPRLVNFVIEAFSAALADGVNAEQTKETSRSSQLVTLDAMTGRSVSGFCG